MKSIQQFIAFASAAKHRSFAVAARELSLAPSTVAKSVARLEDSLGVKLFHRTTRQVRLTPDGEALYQRCVDILEQVEALETTAAATRGEPAGILTLDAPEFYGRRVVLPVVMSLLSTYTELRADVRLSDTLSDVIADGLDAVIRIGPLNDSSLMARQFDEQQLVACASPVYLARQGVPTSVDSLTTHQCLIFRLPSSGRERAWQFLVEGEAVDWHPPTRLRLSNGEAIVEAAVRGGGIAQVPDNMIEEGLADGSLVEVLGPLRPRPLPISIVTPENRLMSSRVRALIDALVADRSGRTSKPFLRQA